MYVKVCVSCDFIIKFNHHRIVYICSMMHLLLPSTATRKLLIAQASYCRITKLRAHLTPKCKKLNIHKSGIVPGFCRTGHNFASFILPMALALAFLVICTKYRYNENVYIRGQYISLYDYWNTSSLYFRILAMHAMCIRFFHCTSVIIFKILHTN